MLKPGYGYESFLCSECGSSQADEQGCMECGAGRPIRVSLGAADISKHDLRQIQLRALWLRRRIQRHTKWKPAVNFLNKIILLATLPGDELPEIEQAPQREFKTAQRESTNAEEVHKRLGDLRQVWTDGKARRWTRCPLCKQKLLDANLNRHLWKAHRREG